LLAIVVGMSGRATAREHRNDGDTVYWGAPRYTVGEHYVLPPDAPEWLVAAFKDGGHFATNVPAWYVPAAKADETPACLYVLLDREKLREADLCLQVELYSSRRASLMVDLADAEFETVATNVAGNLVLDHNELIQVAAALPIAQNESATFIRLRHESGGLIVTETTLLRIPVGAAVDDVLSPTASDAGAPTGARVVEVKGTDAQTENTARTAALLGQLDGTNTITAATGMPGTSTQPRQLSARIIHVSKARGRDAFSGRRRALILEWTDDPLKLGANEPPGYTNAVAAGSGGGGTQGVGGYVPVDGPKRSIVAGLKAARPGGTVVVHSGVYPEEVNLCGRNVSVHICGEVRIADAVRATRTPAAPQTSGSVTNTVVPDSGLTQEVQSETVRSNGRREVSR